MPWCSRPPVRRSSSAAADLEQRQTAVAGEAHRLGDPLVGLDADGDVERGRRDRSRAVPRRPDCARPAARRCRPAAAGRACRHARAAAAAARRAAGCPLRCLGLRRRPLALERPLDLPAGADLRALLGLADRALALRVAGHYRILQRPARSGRRVLDDDAGLRQLGRGRRPRPRSPCARAPRCAARGPPEPARRPPPSGREHASERQASGSRPSRRGHRQHRARASATRASSSVGQRGVAGAHDRRGSTPSAAGTPRSSSIAAANAAGSSTSGDSGPTSDLRRFSTKFSMRRYAVAASSRAASENSTFER